MMSVKSLCETCEHRIRIEAHETGLQYELCGYTKQRLDRLGTVTKCTVYAGRDFPYLFARGAAVLNRKGKAMWWKSFGDNELIRGKEPQ